MKRILSCLLLVSACTVSAALYRQPAIVCTSLDLLEEQNNDSRISPGERVTVEVALQNRGTWDCTDLRVVLLQNEGIDSPSAPENYGAVPVDAPPMSRPFSFTVAGADGQILDAQFRLFDSARDLGTLIVKIPLSDTAAVYRNQDPIQIQDMSSAAPYPSSITVSNVLGLINSVNITFYGLTHDATEDLDILLVGPRGHKIILMSDAGGIHAITNYALTFSDSGASRLPNAFAFPPGTYRPSDFNNSSWQLPLPAPVRPYSPYLTDLVNTDPNGTWMLFVNDGASGDVGLMAGGWSLDLQISKPPELAVQRMPAPDQRLKFTLTVPANRAQKIEVSTNLLDWEIFGQVMPINGRVVFYDDSVIAMPKRYYRARN